MPAPKASGLKLSVPQRSMTAKQVIADIKRVKPAAKGKVKKPVTEAAQKRELRAQIKAHNEKACLKIPPRASKQQLQALYDSRPRVSKRPKKATPADKEKAKRAKEAGDKAFKEGVAASGKKQQKKHDTMIATYERILGMPKAPPPPVVMPKKHVGTKAAPMMLVPRKKKKKD